MSAARTDRKRDDALSVAAALDREGRRYEAESIRRLVRSSDAATRTLSRLWHENTALRKRAAGGDNAD